MADLQCVVCLYLPELAPQHPAVTVLEGYAVCTDHMPYVARGHRWHAVLESARHRGYMDTSGEF